MIEVFTGKAPLADRVEQCGSTCIRIGLDYGQDLNQHSHRRKLLLLIAFCQPTDVWISFPCGCWGPWSRMNMHKDPGLAQSTLDARRVARRHLSIVHPMPGKSFSCTWPMMFALTNAALVCDALGLRSPFLSPLAL